MKGYVLTPDYRVGKIVFTTHLFLAHYFFMVSCRLEVSDLQTVAYFYDFYYPIWINSVINKKIVQTFGLHYPYMYQKKN